MKLSRFKKLFALLLASVMAGTAMAGCSNSGSSSTPASSSPSSAEESKAAGPKEKVLFWYLWSGDTIQRIDDLVATYNAQSDKYEVEAVSTPDSQKILAAIAAQNGPDVSDDFSGNVGKYSGTGILEPLDSYIEKSGFDLSNVVPAALTSCQFDGTTYALPCNINFSALYYNKTLLADAGYTEPPKTLEEMYEMAVNTTKVADDGSLEVLGFPDFPGVYYADNIAIAAGGGFRNEDGTPASADNSGNKLMLKLARDYREKFGLDNVQKFTGGGKYLDPTDPFLLGKQTFRIDGPWMGRSIKDEFKVDVDYGVTYIPYAEGHADQEGRALVSSSMLYVPASAANKEGGFDFAAYFCGEEGQKAITVAGGDFPCLLTLTDTVEGYDTDFYAKLAKSANLVSIPSDTRAGEYDTYVSDQVELCLNLKQDIDTTLQNIANKGAEVFK